MPEHSPTKLAVVVRDDLATWQKLNVTAFLVSGIGTRHPDLIGEPYVDGDDVAYLPMFAHPVLVYAAGDGAALARAAGRAQARGLTMAIYTDDLFATSNDVDNRAAVRPVDHREAGPGRHRRGRRPPGGRQGPRQAAPAHLRAAAQTRPLSAGVAPPAEAAALSAAPAGTRR